MDIKSDLRKSCSLTSRSIQITATSLTTEYAITVKRILEFKEYEYDILLHIDSNPEILRTASIPLTQQQ